MLMKGNVWLLLSVPLGAWFAACNGAGDAPQNVATQKIRVVTTIGMITDIVGIVGGERVQVTGLMGPGIDPHTYRATESDMAHMARADVIFYNGLHLEGKMTDVFEKLHGRVKTVAVTDRLGPHEVRDAPPGYEGTHDPHVWFDVSLWMKAVERVRDTLSELDPSHADVYQANTARYLTELARLHQEVKTKAEKIPAAHRVLVTAHDAFYYFGRAYGFEVHGLQGVSTATEASLADIQKLAQFIAERKVPAIFVESSVSPKTLEAVVQAVKARGFSVAIGGQLYSDAMGDPGTPEGSYVGMVRHNIDTLMKALARPEADR
jgi:manganese/zinc/iron transport system substrate-binding protein